MVTTTSHRAFTGSIISALIVLLMSSISLAVTWEPEAYIDFPYADQYYGAQLAVAEVEFLPEGESEATTLLVAITDGKDAVRLYSFNTSFPYALEFEDEVIVEVTGITTPIAWTPTFMDLDIDEGGNESCLVIPTLHEGSNEGSISIVRLTERDNHDKLIVLKDCLSCDLGTNWSVYHVAELHSSAEYDYAISTEYGRQSPPNHDNDIIALASFDGSGNEFVDEDTLRIPALYYGARHGACWAST